MEKSGLETYVEAKQYFLSQFNRLNRQVVTDPKMNTTMDDQKIKVFLYDSIEMLAKLYQPATGIRVLELVLNKIKKTNSHFKE